MMNGSLFSNSWINHVLIDVGHIQSSHASKLNPSLKFRSFLNLRMIFEKVAHKLIHAQKHMGCNMRVIG